MAKGATFKSEATIARDSRTGLQVRQVTSHASIHHHPFFYITAYDDQMRWLFFVSHRTGTPQIFAEERSTGILRQLTDRVDLNEWSVHPAGPYHDRMWVINRDGSSNRLVYKRAAARKEWIVHEAWLPGNGSC